MKKLPLVCLLLLCSLLLQNCRSLEPVNIAFQKYPMENDQPIAEDSAIVAFLAPYKVQMEAEMNVILGESLIEMTKQKPESTLGNWVADATHQQCEKYAAETIDFAICNYGGIRITRLASGAVTKGNVFEIMPFDNALVVMSLKGDVVQQLFDRMADYGGWPISQTARYQIVDGKSQGIMIKGTALEMDRTYKVGMTDFIANGGDKCFFLEGKPKQELSQKLRDVLMETVEEDSKNGGGISSALDGRVVLF